MRIRVSPEVYHLLPLVGIVLLFLGTAGSLSWGVADVELMPAPLWSAALLIGAACYGRLFLRRRW